MAGIVLITGAARRVGLAIARHLAQSGYGVVLHASSSLAEARAEAESIVARGGQAWALAADLLVHEGVADLIARAAALCGQPITGLINNASIFEHDDALNFTRASWDQHFDLHVRVPCELAQHFALALAGTGLTGSVVNIIDQRVFKLTPQFFTYTLSKATLMTATKTLAQSLAPQIRVNGVAPGPVMPNSRQLPEDFQKQVAATLLETGSPPDAIADAVLWLMRAGSVTGQIIAVDGGQSLIWRTADVDGLTE